MLIDKTKFMVLVAAISATTAGCVIVDNDGDGGGSEGGSGPGTTSSSSQGGGGTGGDATGGGGTGGDATGGGGEGGGGESCLGDAGTPDACSSECEAVIDNCGSVDSLKDGVAVEVVQCLNALDPNTCSAEMDGWGGCFLGSLQKACHDPAVEAPCSALAESCSITDDAAWQTECSSYFSGLSETGRSLVGTCFQDNCANEGVTLEFCTSYAYYVF